MDEVCPEPTTFGDCDFTSYSYLILSVVLSSFGSFITVVALRGADDFIFSQLGHMWLVGPLFICSGMMMAIKTVLYLRRKSLIQMLLRQRALLREFRQRAAASAQLATAAAASGTAPCLVRNPSTLTLPPSYDLLMGAAGQSEAPPPTYEEAMFLIDETLMKSVLDNTTSNSRCNIQDLRRKLNE